MKICCAVATVVMALFSSVAVAEDFKHQESGLQFTLPEGWTCTEKDNKLFIENADKTLSVVGGVIPQESSRAILADIHKFVDSIDGLDDVEIEDGPSKETVNGLVQAWFEGTATVTDGTGAEKEIEWDMTIITGGKEILFLVGTGALEDNEDAYDAFFDSIRKLPSDT